MPILIPNELPAVKTLLSENIFVMREDRAHTQEIRPLEILLLNLMPTKIATETQLARILGNTPLQVRLEFMHTSSHESKNTPAEHMFRFYRTFPEIRDRYYDGMIITGAPVERMPFEEVEYWGELCEIMEWSKTHVHSTFHICWGAQAGLYYHFGIPKHELPEKMFGVFEHRVIKSSSMLMRGFDDIFMVPHSRHTTIDPQDVAAHPELKVVAESDEAGVYAILTDRGRQIFIMGHSEYDSGSLAAEYFRDKAAGLPIKIPKNYFPGDDDTQKPVKSWRAHANLLYLNWLNYFVYQTTPYDIAEIGIGGGTEAEIQEAEELAERVKW